MMLFTVAYMGIASVSALITGNKEFVFYIIVMLVLIAAVTVVHRRVNLTDSILWCLSVWGLAHMAGGLLPVPESWQTGGPIRVLYSLWLIPGYLKYDQVVHAYGFGVTTWLCWQALRSVFPAHAPRLPAATAAATADSGCRMPPFPEPTLGLMTLCAAGGMGFGAFNEVVEFVATLTIPNTNVGGYENTGWDLVFNLLGSLSAACLIRWNARRRP